MAIFPSNYRFLKECSEYEKQLYIIDTINEDMIDSNVSIRISNTKREDIIRDTNGLYILPLTITYNLDINSSDFLKHNYIDIPIVLNKEILDRFLGYTITIKIDLIFPPDYPFKPPKWILRGLSSCNLNSLRLTNLNYKINNNITNYFNNKIRKWNNCNNGNWSPSTTFVYDIFLFLVDNHDINEITKAAHTFVIENRNT